MSASKKRKLNEVKSTNNLEQQEQSLPKISSSSDSESHAKSKSKSNSYPNPNSTTITSENGSALQIEAQKSFQDLGIIESLCEACTKLGYKTPTPIQAQSIPVALEGRDVIGLAETGSGKTCAFALPILQALMEKPSPLFGLVLAPTRELAMQITQQFEALGSIIGVRCATIIGQVDMMSQAIALSKKPHIVVATPGRLLDHLESTKGFNLRNLKHLVMDEADKLLDLDFGPVLDKILKVLPHDGRRTYLFSATISSKVEKLQRASLQNPVLVSVSSSSHQTVSTLLQSILVIPDKHKDRYLVHLLADTFAGLTTIVFVRTVVDTQRVTYLLRALGLSAIPIHGQLSQSARFEALRKFRARSRSILVATDVAARGLDIPSVDIVFNYDLPDDSKTYIHRVGRTARAGKSGRALTLVTQFNAHIWTSFEKVLGKKIDVMTGIDEEKVRMLAETVDEAQIVARRELRDAQDRGKSKGGIGNGRRLKRNMGGGHMGRGHMDQEEG